MTVVTTFLVQQLRSRAVAKIAKSLSTAEERVLDLC